MPVSLRGLKPEVRELVEWAESAGFEAQSTNGGHIVKLRRAVRS